MVVEFLDSGARTPATPVSPVGAGVAVPDLPGPDWPGGRGYAQFRDLMTMIGVLMERALPVGMAVVLGDAELDLRWQLRDQVCRRSDGVLWAGWGPMLALVFRRGLLQELAPAMAEICVHYPDLRIGIAVSESLDDPNDLWLAARLALETAMARRESLHLLDDEDAGRSVGEYRMACAMRRDLQAVGGRFEAHFQPQVFLDSSLPAGAEALARWNWDGVAVPPGVFVPVAEKYGLISRLGETMLVQTARALGGLRREGIDLPQIAVNVSPDQMGRDDFLDMALAVVWDEGLSPSDIELEITESLAGEGGTEFQRWLGCLAEAGFHLAIDDFGTGSSTLARIREIPASKLKLDRAFVAPLPTDASGRRICKMAVNLARSLGMMSLAEGVERLDQAVYLRDAGCRLGQGFYWAAAMPQRQLAEWWRRQSASR